MNPENNNLTCLKRRVQIFSHFLRKNNSNENMKEVTLEVIIFYAENNFFDKRHIPYN